MTTPLNQPVGSNRPSLYANGFKISRASNTTLTVGAGAARSSDNKADIVLSDAVTLDMTVNGLNGLDTGTFAASTWYAIYAVADVTGYGLPGVLASASFTEPTLPLGYNNTLLIGYWYSDASTHFVVADIVGDYHQRTFCWNTKPQVLNAGAATTAGGTEIDLSTGVPDVDNTMVYINVAFVPATANDYTFFNPFGSTATVSDFVYGSVATKINSAQLKVLSKLNADDEPTILYTNSAASGSTTVYVSKFDFEI